MSLDPWRRQSPQTIASAFPGFPEFGRFFDDFLASGPLTTAPAMWTPAVTVSETPDAYVVKAELPGLTAEQVEIQVSDDAITLRGERKEERKEEKENFLRSEFTYGSFMRRVALPSPIDPEHAEASMDKGVLTVKLPRSSATKTRTIKVK